MTVSAEEHARYAGSTFHSVGLLLWQTMLTATAIVLSTQDHLALWMVGQLLLGVCMLQWFILQHDLGHRALIKNARVAAVVGHLSSLFCLLPYWPWQRVHHAHHRWTGWREPDPTIPDKGHGDYGERITAVINFCWRYWVPIFAMSFSLQTFWNLRRLNRLFPDEPSRRRHLFSVLFVVATLLSLALLFRGDFFRCWLPAMVVFMSISDPYLLSQHTHIDYLDQDGVKPVPVPFAVQDEFSRTLRYPRAIERYVFYSSNLHGLHHRVPQVPCYRLDAYPEQPDNDIAWWKWLLLAKRMPGKDLIFLSTRATGVLLQGRAPSYTPSYARSGPASAAPPASSS